MFSKIILGGGGGGERGWCESEEGNKQTNKNYEKSTSV